MPILHAHKWKSYEPDNEEIMSLTPKREKFAHCIADGMTQADAYRTAFSVSPTSKPETVQANASRLMADSMVAARVAELREALAEKSLWSREDSVRTLAEIAKGQDEDAKASARVAAVKALNSMHGWDAAQKLELTGANGGPIMTSHSAFYADDDGEGES